MLVKCPDCRRAISTDIERCPGCGCNIANYGGIFEEVIFYEWNKLSIASVAMIPGYLVVSMLGSLLTFSFASSDNSASSLVSILILFLLYPVIQLIFGISTFVDKRNVYKWPGIVGIVGSAFGIFVGIMLIAVCVSI